MSTIASAELRSTSSVSTTNNTSKRNTNSDNSAFNNNSNIRNEQNNMVAMLRETTIYLNNTAVTLLGTYNNYVAAIQTMKDALELLSTSIQMTQQQSTSAGNQNHSIANANDSHHTVTMANHIIYDVHLLVIQKASQRIQQMMESNNNNNYNYNNNVDTAANQILSGQSLPPPVPHITPATSNTGSNTSATASDTTTTTDETPKMNDIGVVVVSCQYHPKEMYHLLATIRTSKVAIRIDDIVADHNVNTNMSNNKNSNNNDDYYMNFHVVRSILVYNYGIAHRCCIPAPAPTPPTPTPTLTDNRSSSTSTSDDNHHNDTHPNPSHGAAVNNKIGTFCFQIFQYAEQLLIPALESNSNSNSNNNALCIHHDKAVRTLESTSALSLAPNNYLLLYRFILTRNLMMISCKMGMLLCELYKQTLDPIESEILLLQPLPSKVIANGSNTAYTNTNNNNLNDNILLNSQHHSATETNDDDDNNNDTAWNHPNASAA